MCICFKIKKQINFQNSQPKTSYNDLLFLFLFTNAAYLKIL